jgi:membrane protease YdiL (CAAX protease family)
MKWADASTPYIMGFYIGLLCIGLLVNLPYGLSWILGFFALSNLIFREGPEIDPRRRPARWIEIMLLSFLPTAVFVLHDIVPLEINSVFRIATETGREEWFPGVFYLVLYIIPLWWIFSVRKESMERACVRLAPKHLLLILLSTVPIFLTCLKYHGSYSAFFAEARTGSLLLAGLKPFYFNGLWEEFYFRFLLFSLILTRLSLGWAMVLSSLIFAFSHYDLIRSFSSVNASRLLMEMGGIFALGLVTANAFFRTRSIWPGVAFHSFTSGSAYLTAYIGRQI